MTKQEAIEILKGFDLIGSNEDIEFQYALDMAIEALEQKPDIRLKALMKNLKDRDWEMFATYRIDEVEARGIIEAIEDMEGEK